MDFFPESKTLIFGVIEIVDSKKMGETKDVEYEEELLDYEEDEEKAPDSVAAKSNGEAGKKLAPFFPCLDLTFLLICLFVCS